VDRGFTKAQEFEPLLHLVGMKKDLRYQCFSEDHRMGTHQPMPLASFPTCCVSPTDVSWSLPYTFNVS
jgi:Ras family protein A